MAIWMVRAGSHGEYEQKFLQESRVYATWDSLDASLKSMTERSQLIALMNQKYPDTKPKAIINWASQVWPFGHEIAKGDLIVLPLKTQPAIQIGEVIGDYAFHPKGPSPFHHSLPVKWIGEAIPRSHFGQDLLYSFGAFMTICRIQRNNAEARLLAMRKSNWKAESLVPTSKGKAAVSDDDVAEKGVDIEELARDQIAQLIASRFKGHGLSRLVEAILKAQGYTTWRSPEGSDGGADILAGGAPLGFGSPRLCVEVKSQDAPIDRPSVDKLLGAVTKFGADEGLFVSWSGFKGTVQKELAASFFRVRLWSQRELLENLFLYYERLDDDLKADVPLKRIWTVTPTDE